MTTKRLELRLPEETLLRIDHWRSQQSDLPTRPDAIRRLVEAGLRERNEDVRFSPGETLLVTLLCDIQRSLNVDSDVDTRLIREAIAGGHLWGLRQAYSGLFHNEVDDPRHVAETIEILEMWTQLQAGLKTLAVERRKTLATDVEAAGGDWEFSGFDANSEPHYRILRFLIDQLGRYTEFKATELNSRAPTLERYRRMLAVYQPVVRSMQGGPLTDAAIEQVLRASIDPI